MSDLADRIREEASAAARPGQFGRPTAIAEAVERLEATADTGLRERVEGLADEWSTPESHREGAWIRHRDAADHLRGLLATPASTEDRADNEGTP